MKTQLASLVTRDSLIGTALVNVWRSAEERS